MGQALDFISFVPWQFVVAILNVFILYRLVRHFLFKPVQEIFRKRQEEIDFLYESAEKMQSEANSDQALYQEQLSTAEAQAKQILIETQTQAEQEKKRLLEEAHAQSSAILTRTQKEADQMQKQAFIELQSDLSEMAVDIAQKATKQVLSSEDQERLLKQALLQLEKSAL